MKEITNWSDIENLHISKSNVDKEFSEKFHKVLNHLHSLTEAQNELIELMKNNNMNYYSVKGYLKGERFQNYVDFLYYNRYNPYAFEALLREYPNKYKTLMKESYISDNIKIYLTDIMLNDLKEEKLLAKAIYDIDYYYDYNRKTEERTISIARPYTFYNKISKLLYNDLHDTLFSKGRYSRDRIIALVYLFSSYFTEEDTNLIIEKTGTITFKSTYYVYPFFKFIMDGLKTKEQKDRIRALALMYDFRL